MLGIMRLGRRHSNARLDAASARALALGSCRLGGSIQGDSYVHEFQETQR